MVSVIITVLLYFEVRQRTPRVAYFVYWSTSLIFLLLKSKWSFRLKRKDQGSFSFETTVKGTKEQEREMN